jgi:hypothetical protein
MSYKEIDIIEENLTAWVYRDTKNKRYTVFVFGVTHSTSDSSYPLDTDGLSLAVYRMKYLHKRKLSKNNLIWRQRQTL